MQIKTIAGPSIQTALAEARATLGDEVVLLESVAAADGQPAQITVMLDPAPARRAAPRPSLLPAHAAPGDDGGGAGGVAPLGAGYAAARPGPRRPLFAAPTAAPAAPPPVPAPAPEVLDRLDQLSARLGGLAGIAQRLERLERRLDNTALAGGPAWAAHPLYGRLLRSGLAPATAAALLDGAGAAGHTDDSQTLVWAVAQALRDRLAPTAPRRYTADTLVAIGPGGAGKTALLTRLATDPRFYARRDVGVLVVVPEGTPEAAAPGAPYALHGVAARTVRTGAEVREALDRFQGTDALLVDTPALPADDAAARRALAALADVLAPLTAFDVVLAVDAARARPPLDFARLDTLPLRPTLGALTRLDEADDWGRLAEWLLAFDRPVGFATTGPHGDEALVSYSPSWFTERYAHRLQS